MNGNRRIPVLLYHDFRAPNEASKDNFAVAREDFAKQMRYLSDNGFEGVSLERLAVVLASSKERGRAGSASRAKVVLTFDDNDVSHYDFVLPLLRGMDFTGTFFVTVNDVGKDRQMDWAMIRGLAESGMAVGSHGLVHTFLPAFDDQTLADDMAASKRILEDNTGKRVDSLSVPQGFYDRRVLNAARSAGFRTVCASDAGYNDFSTPAPFLLKRFTMRRSYDLGSFRSIVEGRPSMSIVVAERLRTRLRAVLGYRVYDRMRRLRYGTKQPERE